MKTYIVLMERVLGTPGPGGYRISWQSDRKEFPTYQEALRHGVRDLDLCDDFCVGTVENGRLVAVGYGPDNDPCDYDVARIAEEVGL